jgi:hypothetical protein
MQRIPTLRHPNDTFGENATHKGQSRRIGMCSPLLLHQCSFSSLPVGAPQTFTALHTLPPKIFTVSASECATAWNWDLRKSGLSQASSPTHRISLRLLMGHASS